MRKSDVKLLVDKLLENLKDVDVLTALRKAFPYNNVGQGRGYKNQKAFNPNTPDEVCYIPEHGFGEEGFPWLSADCDDEALIHNDVCYGIGDYYTYSDILDIVGGDAREAEIVFELCQWQSPETVCDERERASLCKKYIDDPKTEVFIKHDDEFGKWLYHIQVVDSDGFRLDSFLTLEEAEKYIADNNLHVVK